MGDESFIEGDEDFYKKLLEAYDIKLLGNNWIFTSIMWLISERYRKYCELKQHLKNQIINPSENMLKLASELSDYHNPDKTAVNVVEWIINNITYQSELQEYWDSAEEVLKNKKADCDGMNCLAYTLCYLAGISQFQLFCAIGDVVGGGHFWCLYYSTKEKKLVVIDTTYYPNTKDIKDREDFNDLKKYINIWYLFNQDICIKP